MYPAGALQVRISGAGIDATKHTDSPVTCENLLAKIARIGAQSPLMNTIIGAESEAPRRNFQVAPAAQRTTVRPFGEVGTIGETARHGAGSAHAKSNISSIECFSWRRNRSGGDRRALPGPQAERLYLQAQFKGRRGARIHLVRPRCEFTAVHCAGMFHCAPAGDRAGTDSRGAVLTATNRAARDSKPVLMANS